MSHPLRIREMGMAGSHWYRENQEHRHTETGGQKSIYPRRNITPVQWYNEGSVGPGKFSKTTAITTTSCTLIKAGGCESILKVAARNLPWQGELIETEKEVRNVIKEGTGGNPGWETECETLEGKKKDECTSEEGKEEIVNVENKTTGTLLLVLLGFVPRRHGKCSMGGKEEGEVSGSVAEFAENEWGLRASK
jgi:hypothetical protein